MEKSTIPARNEVPAEYTWRLEDMFPSDDAWMSEYESLKSMPEKVAAFKGHLGDSASSLLEFLRFEDDLKRRLIKLHGYANHRADQDTSNSFYTDMLGKAINIYVAISSAAAFEGPELMSIDEDLLSGFYLAEPELETYRRSLYLVRRTKEHMLSEPEEAILAAAGEVTRAPDDIAGKLRNADMRFPDAADSKGELHTLTAGTYVQLLQSSDRLLRENAYTACYSHFGDVKNTIAATLDAQFKQLKFYSTVRKHPSTLSASLFSTEVPVEVYTNLIDTVNANMDKMYRYVSLRKKVLALDELHMYDMYTPLVENDNSSITYDEAKDTVIKALSVLGDDYISILKEGFSNRWIDVYENKGKRSGAYSSGTSDPHPFVLLNHKNDLDSMFTIAHEMGHAIHSYLSTKNQPFCNSDYVIFVAEVASTCNEILLMRYLLSRAEDRRERAYLVNHFLEQFRATLFRQTMFAEFELEMGRMVEDGKSLTADALCDKYRELNSRYYGPDVTYDDYISLEWARIPHFFYDYYVYQYATGFSAAVAITNRILSLGAPAVADYKKFLSGGCSTDPISLLKIAGVDMSTPDPINSALKLFDELLDEMESLI